MLQLELQKPGDAPRPKLRLSLTKSAQFDITISWDEGADVDVHALMTKMTAAGAKVDDLEQVLSTYNVKRPGKSGVLVARNRDGTENPKGEGWFELPCGALRHSGDKTDGHAAGPDETIHFDGSKVPEGFTEIPIFALIHKPKDATFGAIKQAVIRITDANSGEELGAFQLSTEFAGFNAVQFGSIMLSPDTGWEFAATGVGFVGDFNMVLQHFS